MDVYARNMIKSLFAEHLHNGGDIKELLTNHISRVENEVITAIKNKDVVTL